MIFFNQPAKAITLNPRLRADKALKILATQVEFSNFNVIHFAPPLQRQGRQCLIDPSKS